jgi:hypothetical protein
MRASDIWRELFDREHPDDAGLPVLVWALDRWTEAEAQGEMLAYVAMVKQVDIRIALMHADVEPPLQQQELKKLASAFADRWEQANSDAAAAEEAGDHEGGREALKQRAASMSQMASYVYRMFLDKDPTDPESRSGWERLHPQKPPVPRPEPVQRPHGGLWIVYVMIIIPLVLAGFTLAYFLRSRKM